MELIVGKRLSTFFNFQVMFGCLVLNKLIIENGITGVEKIINHVHMFI